MSGRQVCIPYCNNLTSKRRIFTVEQICQSPPQLLFIAIERRTDRAEKMLIVNMKIMAGMSASRSLRDVSCAKDSRRLFSRSLLNLWNEGVMMLAILDIRDALKFRRRRFALLAKKMKKKTVIIF